MALALAGHLPWPQEEIVRRLYQAPSELLRGLPPGEADSVIGALANSGLELLRLDETAPFTPGAGVWDVALYPQDAARIGDVLGAMALFLGVALAEAARVLWGAPPLLIGRVSDATVMAIRSRFEPLGVEVLASRPDRARFDVCLPGNDALLRHRLAGIVQSLRLPSHPEGLVVSADLPQRDATAVWQRLDRSVPARLVDTAFHRWDLRLDAAPDHEAAARLLATTHPELRPTAARRLLDRLPVVVHTAVSPARRAELELAWAAIGARTSATNVTFQAFHLVIEVAPDPEMVARTLAATLGEPFDAAALRTLPARIAGPFPRLQVRWLLERLRSLGVRLKLEEA